MEFNQFPSSDTGLNIATFNLHRFKQSWSYLRDLTNLNDLINLNDIM